MIFLRKDELSIWLNLLDETRDITVRRSVDGNEPVITLNKEECRVLNKVMNQVHAGLSYGIKMP